MLKDIADVLVRGAGKQCRSTRDSAADVLLILGPDKRF